MAAPPRSPAPEPIPPAPQAAPVRPRPATTAQAAPMPDPQLSSDIAAELLEPATNAAVRANFARLNTLALGNSGLTIEALMREMLRPMLKDWLDEHLPAVVERMVEKEISRISRGVE
jgi:cell pole-organizing protein PopZ